MEQNEEKNTPGFQVPKSIKEARQTYSRLLEQYKTEEDQNVRKVIGTRLALLKEMFKRHKKIKDGQSPANVAKLKRIPGKKHTNGKVIKQSFALPNGDFAWLPERIAPLDPERNVFGVPEAQGATLPELFVKEVNDRGNYLLILQRLKTKPSPFVVMEVTAEEIIKAREQRFELIIAFLGMEHAVREILLSVDKIDKRYKNPEAFIKKHKDAFFESVNPGVIAKDLKRITDGHAFQEQKIIKK